MAGVYCIIMPPHLTCNAVIARRISVAMLLFPWQGTRVIEAEPGRVWLGAVANARDDAALERVSGCVGHCSAVIEGWLLRSRVECGAEPLIAKERYAEAVLAAYGRLGKEFASALEGQFNAIVHDRDAGVVVIGNSRHEHSPLYLAERGAAFGAATSLGPLGACGLFKPVVDPHAAASFLAYGQLFDDETLLDGVRVMDQATVLEVTVDGAHLRATRYWDLSRVELTPTDQPPREQVGHLVETLRAAGRRAAQRGRRLVAGLSGGLDSRLNLAAVAPHAPGLVAWTFGAPGAADLETAAAVCRILGIQHLTYPIDPMAIERNALDFVSTVDGSMTAAFAYQLDRARDLRERADVVCNGYAGEVIVRGSMLDLKEKEWIPYARGRLSLGPPAPHPRFECNRDKDAVVRYLQCKYGRLTGLFGVARPAIPQFAELIERSLSRLRATVPAHLLAEAWIVENRGRRWTMMGIVSDRHFYADASVFYDYDFQDGCFAIPARHRRGGRLYLPLLTALAPQLASVPSGNTGLPVGASRARFLVSHIVARAWGRRRGVSTGASPADWARGPLREACSALIDDTRTRERPWWDDEALVRSWLAHLAGEVDFAAEIGLIAAVELFCRRWVDPFQA